MRKQRKALILVLSCLLALTCFFLPQNVMNSRAAQIQGEVIFSGNQRNTGKDSEILNLFTAHAGGNFDASLLRQGCSIQVTYVGEENGIYLALSSASGGPNWVAVYPDSCQVQEDGSFLAIFTAENMVATYGTDFPRLDVIHVYNGSTGETRVTKLEHIPGEGALLGEGDAAWDRPMEGIAFVGDSIVQNPIYLGMDWNGILNREDCVNYGIGGQTTVEVAKRFDAILAGDYHTIVFLCGINDLGQGKQLFVTISNYRKMLDKVKEKQDETGVETKVYVLSLLPTTSVYFTDSQDTIDYVNLALENLLKDYSFASFVNVHDILSGEDGYGQEIYFSDGLHPNVEGYAKMAEILAPLLESDSEVGTQVSVSFFVIAAVVVVAIGVVFLVVGGRKGKRRMEKKQ